MTAEWECRKIREENTNMKRRVVVTGLGVVSPVGNDRESFWQALHEGRSGIGKITRDRKSVV